MTIMQPLPQLRDDQKAILNHPARIKVIACGRRWGKTTMAGIMALAMADHGGSVAWVAPTYSNARPLWRFCEKYLVNAPDVHQGKSEHTMRWRTGGRLSVYTAERDVALRGENFDLVIVDEAARIKEETYTDVILPTLADTAGRAMLISTPKGKNWFWKEFLRGLTDDPNLQGCFTAPSSANPLVNIQKAAVLAESTVSRRTYQQEWLAQFVEDGGGVFKGVENCVKQYPDAPDFDKHYVIGVDWGRNNDATVFVVLCVEDKQVCEVVRILDVAYHMQLQKLEDLASKWKPYDILAEQNSMGGPLVEALQRKELPVRPFLTTAQSKTPLIDALALAIERQEIGLLDNKFLIGELQAYESQTMPSGVIRFNAPAGFFDDCVIACALAWKSGGYGNSQVVLFGV